MNKKELIDQVAGVTGETIVASAKAVDTALDCIAKALASGTEVSIAGFGTFVVKATAERKGRNPKTGESITIAAGKKVSFKVAKGLKDAIA